MRQNTAIGTTATLKDKRDNQEYTIAKLKDGNIWMTKNLNLAGGTTLTPADSDVAENYTLPVSSTTGFDDDNRAFVYNSGNNDDSFCDGTSNGPCYSYYSWNAATVESGKNIITNDTDAPYSICPLGWKLPTSRSTVAGNSDFYQLAVAYGMDPNNIWQQNSNFYVEAGPGTVPNLLPANYIINNWYADNQVTGWYSSATSFNESSIRALLFKNYGYVGETEPIQRRTGIPVRCLLR